MCIIGKRWILFTLIVTLFTGAIGSASIVTAIAHELDHANYSLLPDPILHISEHDLPQSNEGDELDPSRHSYLHATGHALPFLLSEWVRVPTPTGGDERRARHPFFMLESLPDSLLRPPRSALPI